MRHVRLAMRDVVGLLAAAAMVLAASAFAAEPDAGAETATRKPVPNVTQLRTARQAFLAKRKPPAANASPGEHAKFAEGLMRDRWEAPPEGDKLYVLLTEALQSAEKGQSFEVANDAIKALASEYEVDGPDLMADSFGKIVPQLGPRYGEERARKTADELQNRIENALRADALAPATSLCRTLEAFLNRFKLTQYQRQVVRYHTYVNEARPELVKADAARRTLKTRPDDAGASAALGRFLCLVHNDWDHGVEWLAKGKSDAMLKIAQADLAARESAAHALGAADALWDLSMQEQGLARACARRRARKWYLEAVPELQPEDQGRARSRVRVIDIAWIGETCFVPNETHPPFPVVRNNWGLFNLVPGGQAQRDFYASETQRREVANRIKEIMGETGVAYDFELLLTDASPRPIKREADGGGTEWYYEPKMKPWRYPESSFGVIFGPRFVGTDEKGRQRVTALADSLFPRSGLVRLIGIAGEKEWHAGAQGDRITWGMTWTLINPMVLQGNRIVYMPDEATALAK